MMISSGGDSTKALTIIYEMLDTCINVIEANAHSIKENSSLQDSNFAAMRSFLCHEREISCLFQTIKTSNMKEGNPVNKFKFG